VAVYTALLENVNQNLDSLHRYLRLKQRMLGVEKLKYSDVYAPVVQEMDRRYSVEEAKKLILAAAEPMGPEYAEVVRRAFAGRWIDMYPTAGKQSGAYSSGSAYDVHPYILMNYNERYDDVRTLMHELGHTLHSYYANQTQPYATAYYSLFVAEVASTFNEALLMNRMLAEIQEVEMRLSLLMNYVEGVRQTVFRQSQFAEFELRMHETAERGEPLTGEILSRMYGEILKKYYGHVLGVCEIDDLYFIEWAFIPHFYRHYYVYQYATSFTASTMLAERVLKQEAGAVEKYIELISAGGSDYPVNLLQKAGVDMTTPAPFAATMQAMNRAMDEVEILLEKRKQHE
jgi:oligoendopeptidase F